MAKIEKEVIKTYKLELSPSEYHTILCLVGGVPYDDFVDIKNKSYRVRFGNKEENPETISYTDFKNLYKILDDNK